MESDDGFRSFSRAIKTDPIGLLLAKWRLDVFTAKLKQLPDVVDVIPSGSLARSTQIGPVHDVDLIVVFDKTRHQDYGIKGGTEEAKASAQASLDHLEGALREELHPWLGAAGELGKESEQRTHVVKYNGDWTGPFAEVIPSAPPVDVMPAVREGSHLLIPERGTGWIDVDPERLIREVAQRQREWEYFTEVVGMVKAWAKLNRLEMKNLAVEVMVLQHCPRPRLFETLSVGDAVARFFESAAKAKITSLKDWAGRCGEIDPSLNFEKLQKALTHAADRSRKAVEAERAWENREFAVGEVTHPVVFWREVFGKKYPRARERFWRAPEAESWFKYTAEPMGPDGPDGRKAPGRGPTVSDGPDGRDGRDGGSRRRPSGPRPAPYGAGDGPAGPANPRGPRPTPAPAAASAEPRANYWRRVLGPTPAAATVPLTYG
jgi:hypothetical protein